MSFTYNSTVLEENYTYFRASTTGDLITSTASKPWTTATELSQTVFVYAGILAADPIVVEYKDNELSASVTLADPSSSNSSSLAPSKTSSITSVTSTAPSTPSQRGGLSSGAKAGVGAGVAVGVCAIIAVILLIYRSRKRRIIRGNSIPRQERPELSDKPMKAEELSSDAMKARELPDSSPQELDRQHATT